MLDKYNPFIKRQSKRLESNSQSKYNKMIQRYNLPKDYSDGMNNNLLFMKASPNPKEIRSYDRLKSSPKYIDEGFMEIYNDIESEELDASGIIERIELNLKKLHRTKQYIQKDIAELSQQQESLRKSTKDDHSKKIEKNMNEQFDY